MKLKDGVLTMILGGVFIYSGVYVFPEDPAHGLMSGALGSFCLFLGAALLVQPHILQFRRAVSDLQRLAKKLPTGLIDPKAVEKLHREMEEIDEETTFVDKALEAGDVMYYISKAITNGLLSEFRGYFLAKKAIRKVGKPLNFEMAIAIAVSKYKFRAKPGNPKDAEEERKIAEKVISKFV